MNANFSTVLENFYLQKNIMRFCENIFLIKKIKKFCVEKSDFSKIFPAHPHLFVKGVFYSGVFSFISISIL